MHMSFLFFRNVYLCERQDSNTLAIVKDIELNFKVHGHEQVGFPQFRIFCYTFTILLRIKYILFVYNGVGHMVCSIWYV